MLLGLHILVLCLAPIKHQQKQEDFLPCQTPKSKLVVSAMIEKSSEMIEEAGEDERDVDNVVKESLEKLDQS